ncbi:MAG TPA: MASE1 domain-containing protein [Tepidisphaeraceae bacterium]|nr:MASE1 domain-containing protein [Tepidisphaeraceae bacterium]
MASVDFNFNQPDSALRGGQSLSLNARILVITILIIIGCYLSAWLGTVFIFPGVGTAVLFPSYAVLAAALIHTPVKSWWILVLAAVAGNLWPHWQYEQASPFVFIAEIANVLRALIAALGFRKLSRRIDPFEDLRSMAVFIAFAVVIAPAAGALVGAGAVELRHSSTSFWIVFQAWLLSNMLTGLVLLPLILTAWTYGRSWIANIRESRYFEGVLLTGITFIAAALVFDRADPQSLFPVTVFMIFPLLAWASLRFVPGGLITLLGLISTIAINGALHNRGPFVSHAPAENLLHLQYFLIAMCLPLLLLKALLREQLKTASDLRNSERLYREVVETQQELVCRYRPDTTLIFVNDAYCRYFKKPREELIGRKYIELIPEAVRQWTLDHVQAIIRDRTVRPVDHEVIRPDGTIGWQQWVDYVVSDGDGCNTCELQGIGHDITELKRAEQSLRESESRLRASYEKIQDLAGRLIVAEEAERKRISRELHDGVNQQLAALSIRLSGIKRRLPEEGDALKQEIASIQAEIIELAESVRSLSHELHPGILQHAGLVPALRAHCMEFQGETGIETSFTSDGDDHAIPPDLSLCIYRVAQEALRNVVNHAQAKRVQISLTNDQRRLRLRIDDDGCGFDPKKSNYSGGLGLMSMEERIRLVQGEIIIDSYAQRGTNIQIDVPLEGGPNAADQGIAGG